jgi:mevalonate kinase
VTQNKTDFGLLCPQTCPTRRFGPFEHTKHLEIEVNTQIRASSGMSSSASFRDHFVKR